ncbi:hypothetical protein GOBAR_DD32426 [Gossypium barbadense]|nr:hypothetical protein GOBAR_DD32426 [Gossypium barbadense]
MKLEEVMDLELGCGQYGIIIMNRSSISFCLFFPPQLKRQPCRRGFSGLAGSESLDSAKIPLRHLFRTVDKDGSGYITVDELQQACAEHNMTDVLLEDIIREVDQDNGTMSKYICRSLILIALLLSVGIGLLFYPLIDDLSFDFLLLQDGRIDYGEFVAMVLIFSLLADCTADPEYDDS